ncbi:HAD family hydrolase [Oceaniglobus ichthyenteri]|uniref:HAD family hydrolase n=1 Tax=Oceaniglobus ichthyenteri TaxID=2136177 RepID=UPI000D3600D2|nr:HAD family phosphatase [Oceaniglobus ichthyenteri]
MKALLLDLDGTIVDSDPVHVAVFIDLLAEFGHDISAEHYFTALHGRQNVAIFSELLPNEDPQAMSERKEAMYRERLDQVAPIAGLPDLLARARARGVKLGVVTNAPRANADAVLAAFGMSDTFDTIVIGEECARGKPDPLPYATGLANLGADPAHSFAVEDSPAGIRSAVAAGLYTFGMRSSLTAEKLLAAGAHDTITDFNARAIHTRLDRLTGATV